MEFVPAPFWRRLVARLIDLLVCVPLTFLAVIPVAVIIVPLSAVISDDAASSLGAFLSFLVAYGLVEYFLLRRRSGQTLGKGLLGLRVLNASDTAGIAAPAVSNVRLDYGPEAGEPVGVAAVSSALGARAALVRMVVLIGPLMLALAGFYLTYDEATGTSDSAAADALLWLWIAVLAACALSSLIDRKGRRGLHDFAAGTRVVRAQKRGIDLREDLKMLVPGKVSLEKRTPPPVTLAKTLN